MTITELIERKRAEYRTNIERFRVIRDMPEVSPQVEAEVVVLRARQEAILADVSRLEGVRAEEAEADRLANQITPAASSPNERAATVRVGSEARQYRADDAATGRPTFLQDLYRSQVQRDPSASERLARHGAEVEVEHPDFTKRAAGTGAVSGFVPPQYLVDLWAELARAGRPVADLCTTLPLPETGMTFSVPRITTGTATGVQTAENTTVSSTDIDDTLLTAPLVTIAGYNDMSRQSIERGIMVDRIVFGDLAADYNAKLDAQVINGSGSSGQHLGILGISSTNTVTYTDASPSVSEMWPKLADLVRKVASQRFTGATGIVMTPDMWGWFLAAQDTTGRPLIDANGTGQNSLGTSNVPQYEGAAGALLKVPVYLSGNIPTNLGAGTNETRIIAADFRDLFLAEENGGAPVQLRFDDVLSGSLGVRLLAYGYSAFIAGRQPKAISVMSGTGLVPQAL